MLTTLYAAPRLLPITFVENSHRHQCLSTRFYTTFSGDSESPNVDTSGGETDGDTDHEDEVGVSAPEISQNHQVVAQVILCSKIKRADLHHH